MTEGLTARDYQILEAAFLPAEIGSKDGKPYIKRSAIMRRLRLVDPGYIPDIDTIVQVVGDTVTVWGTLTLKGVTHRASSSVAVGAWRIEDPKATIKTYVRVGDYEYARALANAQKIAATLLLFRCAETFGVGLYMKEKTTTPSLASVLNAKPTAPNIPPPPPESPPMPSNVTKLGPQPEPESEIPKHWALNGGGERIKQKMHTLGLDWHRDLKAQIEPGKTLEKLSYTTLTEEQVSTRLDEIHLAMMNPAQPKGQPSGEEL